MVAGETSPERTLHRQLRQRPRAPHVASMATPAARAASSSEAPRPIRVRRIDFAPSGSTKQTSIPLPSASFIALLSSRPGTSRSAVSGYVFGRPLCGPGTPRCATDPGRLPLGARASRPHGQSLWACGPLRAGRPRSQESAPALTVVGIALRPTPLAAPPRASARASPPAPRRGPSRRRRTRRPIPGWSARRPPGSSPSRGARP